MTAIFYVMKECITSVTAFATTGKIIFLVAEPEWPIGKQHCACCTDGHGFESQTYTNACGHICK